MLGDRRRAVVLGVLQAVPDREHTRDRPGNGVDDLLAELERLNMGTHAEQSQQNVLARVGTQSLRDVS
ncbi:hypothetical protein L3Q65_21055 [Amycolatopsis sp. FU40]|uniref:hypothetical protein n=1 Tax=Amycolatopsis sp. FU40 TaxID=2914159 RepID=UPI001F1FF792|nr:hypothetical protein [Amycolatopsis sp. FU40]UKD59107.1 hypothetical protein L3Q65_21055 [Amycolatopsis sp. FU40]